MQRQAERCRQLHRDRQRETETDRDRQRQAETGRDWQGQAGTGRDRQRQRYIPAETEIVRVGYLEAKRYIQTVPYKIRQSHTDA